MDLKQRWEWLLYLAIIISTYAYNLIHLWMDGADLTELLGFPYTLVTLAILCAVMSTVPFLVIVNIIDAFKNSRIGSGLFKRFKEWMHPNA